MLFSEVYSLELTQDDDWFDTFLPADTNLCVDPFLIYEEPSGRWASAHDRILDFFALVFHLVQQSNRNEESIYWKQAQRLLLFPEPYEFCLGVADGTPQGAGAGPGLQRGMLEGIAVAVGLGIDNVPHMEMLSLFEGGMGLDRISDVVCNILKSELISYTQDVCKRRHVPMDKFVVKNAAWSDEFARWESKTVELPRNPFLKKPGPVILVPERFLRDIPVVTANEFWRYAWTEHAAEVRGDFNFDIARKVPRKVKARLARENPVIVEAYLESLESEQHEPYPVQSDPKLLINWYEVGAGLSNRAPIKLVPQQPSEFRAFVTEVVDEFRRGVEDQGDWQLLWHKGISRNEATVQRLFRSTVIHHCRAHNIDLSGEANAGRGPVDFKFSQGWDARALVELKLIRNTKYWDGILAQTPQYAKSEEIKAAFFVAIAYTDADMVSEKVGKVHKAAKIAGQSNSLDLKAVIIDARRKDSASKLKASEEDRQKLDENEDETEGPQENDEDHGHSR